MVSSSKKSVGVKASTSGVGGKYETEIKQEVITITEHDFKIIPDVDGQGYTAVRTNGSTAILLNRRFVKKGILRTRLSVQNDVLEMRDDGVYQNGRKL